MSRSNPQNNLKVTLTDAPYKDIPEEQRYYIGRDKGRVDVSVQQPDRYSYERWAASRRLKLPEWDLADEPDNDRFNLKEKENGI